MTARSMTDPCLHDPKTDPMTDAQARHALDAAAARITAAGGRLTTPRRRVLELLLQAPRPVKAYDLVARFHTDRGVAKPATVYRALAFLETMGLVHRLSTLKSYVACHRGLPVHSAAFLICECCGALQEVAAPETPALATAAASHGYAIDRITLEAAGRCRACRTKRRDRFSPAVRSS